MRLLLIQPNSKRSIMGQTSRGKAGMVRLSLPMLAALTPPDVDIRIIDGRVQSIDFNAPADLVGITSLTCEAPFAYEIARKFREKDVPVVIGGYHPTLMPQEAGDHADAVVIGEAELLWKDLIEDFRNGKLRKFYLADKLCDMDSDVPVPRRDLLDRSKYYTFNTVQATRGCTRGCSFCAVAAFCDHKFRKRSPQNVVSEIQQLLNANANAKNPHDRTIFFIDDNLMLDPSYAKSLFKELIPLRIKWSCQTTTAMAEDEELLHLAAKSGCVFVSVGFESINPKSLQWLNKNWAALGVKAISPGDNPTEEIKEAFARTVEKIHNHRICVLGNFMLGFDDDNPEMIQKTIMVPQEIKLDAVYFHILTPMPGTKLHTDLEREHRIISRDWEKYDSGHVVFAPKQLFLDELQDYYWQAYQHFYSPWRIIARTFLQPHNFIARISMNWSMRRKVQRLVSDKNEMRRSKFQLHQQWFSHYADLHSTFGKWAEVRDLMDRTLIEIRRSVAAIQQVGSDINLRPDAVLENDIYQTKLKTAIVDLDVRLSKLLGTLEDVRDIGPTKAEAMHSGKMAMLKRIASSLTHEIKGPISNIINGLREAEKELLDHSGLLSQTANEGKEEIHPINDKDSFQADLKQILEDIRMCLREIKSIHASIERLRNLAGLGTLDKGPMDIVEAIKMLLQPLERQYKGRINVNQDFFPVGRINCDVRQMQEVFNNVLKNAFESIERTGQVAVSTRQIGDGKIEVKVVDSGSGIPPNLLPEIFDPFFSTKEISKGDGWGLAMCKATVEAHNGTIAASSAVGQGTTIAITLPGGTSHNESR